MAQELTNNLLNDLLDNGLPANLYLAAHSASPGLTGANEAGVARVTATFAAATAGVASITNTVSISVGSTTTITHVGLWSHITSTAATHFRGQEALSTAERFEATGTLAVTAFSVDLTNHPA